MGVMTPISAAIVSKIAAAGGLIPILVLIGQSNAVGVGAIASAPAQYQGTISGATIWNGTSFVALTAGITNQAANGSSLGVEMSLAKQYIDLSPATQVKLIKHAVSNTSLAVDWLAPSGTQLVNAKTKIDAAMGSLTPNTHYIAGFVWIQGENDALSASATNSNNYQTNLTALISNLRTAYGSSIPFIAVQLGMLDRNSYYYQDNVRQAQIATQAALSNVKITQSDDLGYNADRIHYNATALAAMGERAAAQLQVLNSAASYVENRPPSYQDITFWFDPSTFNTCLDGASAPVTAGNEVNAVLGRHVTPLNNPSQLGAGLKPTVQASQINGRQALRFDGTNDQLVAAGMNPSLIMGATSGTIILVQKVSVAKASTTVFINAGANSNINASNKWTSAPFDDIFWDFANTGTGRMYGTAPAGITGNWKITEFVKRTDGTGQVYVGNVSALSASQVGTMTSATGNFRIGSDGSNFFNGDIAEILCYNKALSTTERAQLYAYLNTKYGI